MKTIEEVKRRAELDAKSRGYFLTPDKNLLQDLLRGLMENEERYGYPVCPCRIGTGNFENDRDIICPCDYRDPDVLDLGMCYCSLFVNKSIFYVNSCFFLQYLTDRHLFQCRSNHYGCHGRACRSGIV